MTGPFDKLSPQKAQEFADGIIGAICVTTGLSLQSRLQHAHVDLFTDYELEEPEIMVRFALLPFVTYNDYEDLTNDEFLDRIREPIDSELIALTIFDGQEAYWFHSVADSLAISYDGGVVYEPTSNKTIIKVKIEHEKGYSTGGLVGMTLLCLFGMIFLVVGVTWFRFKRSAASTYDTLE